MNVRVLLASMGALALFAPTSMAFAPDGPTWQGIEPIRVHHTHPVAQANLRDGNAWRYFADGEGQGWQARFDEVTGQPRRMWGPGLDLGPVDTEQQVIDAVTAFLFRHPTLLGAEQHGLSLRSVNYVERMDTWYIDFDAMVGGAPIWRGGITARIKYGRLIMVGSETYPGVEIRGAVAIDAGTAMDVAMLDGPEPGAVHTDSEARLVQLPIEKDGELWLQRMWETRSRTVDPPGKWVSFVDAQTGELYDVYNEVRFFQGGLWGEHDARTVNGEMSTSPLREMTVTDGVYSTETDEIGFFELSDDAAATLSTDFGGKGVDVRNSGGPESEPEFSEAYHTITADEADQAEIDTYVFLHQVREWGRATAPEVAITHDRIRTTVNINDNCNAWYDGSLNFLRAGGGCNNTGRIADVNYHEWGHGFHYDSIQSGFFDGSMSEGASDVVSIMMTRDPVIAPYFATNGSGIRNVSPDQVYPEDFVNTPDFVHYNGLIFGGSMWDLYNILTDKYDDVYAHTVTSSLLAGILKGGTGIDLAFDEALVADDDDGDLGNGTPHECEIIDAFARHGLGPLGSAQSIIGGHQPLPNHLPGTDHIIHVRLVSPSPTCFDYDAQAGEVVYRVNGGDWDSAQAIVDGGDIEAAIPAQAAGTFVEYFLEIDDISGATLKAPTGGYINPYSFYVGDVITVALDDFEKRTDWTHELLSGEDQEGADDWQRGAPAGRMGDPYQAYSGSKVWGNDLGEGEFNGAYQPDKRNRLTSPEFDLGHYSDVYLQYYRWLNVEDGFYDAATILADGETIWSNWATDDRGGEHHQDQQWVPHSVDLGEAIDDGLVQLSFQLQSDGGLEFGGWTIDDVALMAPATPDNRLGISDFNAEPAESGGIALQWTNPGHAPLTGVRVVRQSGSFPTGPQDGEVIFVDGEPELGGTMSIIDKTELPASVTPMYAVYTTDGEHWLSFTVPGWNADSGVAGVSGSGGLGGDGEGGIGDPVGCGCSGVQATGMGTGATWMFALLGVAGLRRRRQRFGQDA